MCDISCLWPNKAVNAIFNNNLYSTFINEYVYTSTLRGVSTLIGVSLYIISYIILPMGH